MTIINEALWIENGEGAPRAHRVVVAGSPHHASIDGRQRRAIIVREIGRGGSSRPVPMSDLAPAAPLTAAEEAEYRRLDHALAGTIGDGAKLKRFNALRLRSLLFTDGKEIDQ